jgi:hypothetical protein
VAGAQGAIAKRIAAVRVKGGLRLAYLPEPCIRGSINDDLGFGVLANVTLIDRSEILKSGSVQSTKPPRSSSLRGHSQVLVYMSRENIRELNQFALTDVRPACIAIEKLVVTWLKQRRKLKSSSSCFRRTRMKIRQWARSSVHDRLTTRARGRASPILPTGNQSVYRWQSLVGCLFPTDDPWPALAGR